MICGGEGSRGGSRSELSPAAQIRRSIYDLNAYDYDLPQSLIAQTPAVPRDAARLLVWRVSNGVEHQVFGDIVDYLRPGDLLVLNDTRVLPVRLRGVRADSKVGGKAEILLLSPVSNDFDKWRALVRPGRRLGIGSGVAVGGRVLTIVGEEDDGVRIVQAGTGRKDVLSFLDKYGSMPLPPYIKNIKNADPLSARLDYQTVFALNDGSAAAPTAGLHFTKELIRRVEERGTEIARVTLHVGLGTFRPVKSLDIRKHRIHSEYCQVPKATETAVRACRARQGRVVAVGTTVVRTLESMADGDGTVPSATVKSGSMDTDLFIYPGYSYKVVDALITNFHLPKSSLLMLVSAFVNHLEGGGREEAALDSLRKIYSLAVSERYRFFSFGDAMYIEK